MIRTAYEIAEMRAKNEALARHYRAIGPAAIMAALLCMPRKRPLNPRPA